jgi:hypothetical protein
MIMEHYVNPSRENFDLYKSLPRDVPVHLLNMIRYRDYAAYPEGHEYAAKGWTGEQAFAEYLRRLLPMLARMGAGMAWEGRFEGVITGPAEFEWDRVFVMGFPTAGTFLALVTDPEYKANVVVHRTAAVLDSRLVRYGVG